MKTLWIAILSLSVLTMVGCATTGQQVKTEAPAPVFDWNPPEDAVAVSSGVTFGIVGGSYAEEAPWTQAYPFNTFRENMRSDFDELMTERGFTTTGPFETVDEMTYPDKKGCDLILQPTFGMTLSLTGVQAEEHVEIFSDNYYTVNGSAVIGGRVTLAVVESLSGTRMWNKSVAIEQASIPWKGEKRHAIPPSTEGVLLADEPGLQKAIAPHLEKAYGEILDKAWDYLHPEEMKVVKTQAMEVKEKTTFSGSN